MISIGHDGLRRNLVVADGRLATTSLELGDRTIQTAGAELALELDESRWRHDIPTWRWQDGEDRDIAAGAMRDEFDDAGWRIVPHLHPVFTLSHDEPSWFRAWMPFPESARGEPVSIVIGGYDDEDWSQYTVHLGGVHLGDFSASGSIRRPHVLELRPGSAGYDAIRFGADTLLAVRAEGLQRSALGQRAGEDAHYFFQGWLVDQYVAVGGTTEQLDRFEVTSDRGLPNGHEVDLVCTDRPSITATIRYWSEGRLLRKGATIRNEGPEPVRLLDVILEEWTGDLEARGGGRGQPAFMAGGFVGLEHPAGVQFCASDTIRVVQMPGVTIAPGEEWATRPVVIGGGADGDGATSAFVDYVRDLRPRPTERVVAYSPLGWYDFTNPADPLPELTDTLALHNLDRLAALDASGVHADVYMFDDWWDDETLDRFRLRAYPNGPGAVVERVRELGMRPGLWWATTRALWSASRAAFLEPSLANSPGFGAPVALAGGTWAWLEEFGNLFIGERRYCLAAEPYRSHARASITSHVSTLEARMLKLDCVVLHCTSSDHDHRPGRHSVEPMVDAAIEIVESCRSVQPDLLVVWYWGFRSPWFLAHGDHLFDKGLLLEAATPASNPAPTSRQGMTLNVDQSIEHAETLPMELQDSLGVWVGDVAWCNRIGAVEWQEAMLMDAARPSWLVQPWGDLDLLGADGIAELARMLTWIRRIGHGGSSTARVGGSAWLSEPYGYARPADGGWALIVCNPSWQAASITWAIPTTEALRVVELYPSPGIAEGTSRDRDGVLTVELRPFETRVLAVVPASRVSATLPAPKRSAARPSRALEVAGPPRNGSVESNVKLDLPDIGFGDGIMVTARFLRKGAWWYNPEPHRLVQIEPSLDGLAVQFETTPRSRDRNGPGSPWVLYRIPAGPAWSRRTLDIRLQWDIPEGVEVQLAALVVHEWWRHESRTFRDLLSG